MKYSGGANLLATLESIDVENGSPVDASTTVESRQIGNGFTVSLEKAQMNDNGLFGLFICKDSHDVGRCGIKPARSIAEIANNLIFMKKGDMLPGLPHQQRQQGFGDCL